jgi:hypothetical protein
MNPQRLLHCACPMPSSWLQRFFRSPNSDTSRIRIRKPDVRGGTAEGEDGAADGVERATSSLPEATELSGYAGQLSSLLRLRVERAARRETCEPETARTHRAVGRDCPWGSCGWVGGAALVRWACVIARKENGRAPWGAASVLKVH